MKILFVCRANVGRSQMAAELYNKIRPGDAESAGTLVDLPGQKLKELAGSTQVVVAMKDYGVDMSEDTRTQITPEMLKSYDKVIVMAEPETIPEYLKNYPKTEIWTVEDAKGKTVSQARLIRDHIKELITDLAKRLHP